MLLTSVSDEQVVMMLEDTSTTESTITSFVANLAGDDGTVKGDRVINVESSFISVTKMTENIQDGRVLSIEGNAMQDVDGSIVDAYMNDIAQLKDTTGLPLKLQINLIKNHPKHNIEKAFAVEIAFSSDISVTPIRLVTLPVLFRSGDAAIVDLNVMIATSKPSTLSASIVCMGDDGETYSMAAIPLELNFIDFCCTPHQRSSRLSDNDMDGLFVSLWRRISQTIGVNESASLYSTIYLEHTSSHVISTLSEHLSAFEVKPILDAAEYVLPWGHTISEAHVAFLSDKEDSILVTRRFIILVLPKAHLLVTVYVRKSGSTMTILTDNLSVLPNFSEFLNAAFRRKAGE